MPLIILGRGNLSRSAEGRARVTIVSLTQDKRGKAEAPAFEDVTYCLVHSLSSSNNIQKYGLRAHLTIGILCSLIQQMFTVLL